MQKIIVDSFIDKTNIIINPEVESTLLELGKHLWHLSNIGLIIG